MTGRKQAGASSSVRRLSFAVAIAIGVLGGLGAFMIGYGNGLAYLTNDPEACANCHISAALPGSTVEDSIAAPIDYARLDSSGNPVRIRLSSTVAQAANSVGGGV